MIQITKEKPSCSKPNSVFKKIRKNNRGTKKNKSINPIFFMTVSIRFLGITNENKSVTKKPMKIHIRVYNPLIYGKICLNISIIISLTPRVYFRSTTRLAFPVLRGIVLGGIA